jgi:hypothetical protein
MNEIPGKWSAPRRLGGTPLRKFALEAGAIITAVLVIALIAIPVSFWHHPTIDASFSGLDPNLISITDSGDNSAQGTVNVDPHTMRITAPPGSHPTVQLLTTPLSFMVSFDVVILASQPNDVPLRVGLWSPAASAGYFVVFSNVKGSLIHAQTIIDGVPKQDLVGGTIQTDKILGKFITGLSYRVSLKVDRANQTIAYEVSHTNVAPFGLTALRLGDPKGGGGVQILSAPIRVAPGSHYSFGGYVNGVQASDLYAIGVYWWDRSGNRLPFLNWWRRLRRDLAG